MNPIRSLFGREASVPRDPSLCRSWPLFAAAATFATVALSPHPALADKDKRITCMGTTSVANACALTNDSTFPSASFTTFNAHWSAGSANTAKACRILSTGVGGACDPQASGGTTVSLTAGQRVGWGANYSSHFPYLAINNTTQFKGMYAHTTSDSLPSTAGSFRTACTPEVFQGIGDATCSWTDSTSFRSAEIAELRAYFHQTSAGSARFEARACYLIPAALGGGGCSPTSTSGSLAANTTSSVVVSSPWVGITKSQLKYISYSVNGSTIKGIRATKI